MILSAVVVAQDEEARLAPCLASLAFADELLVVDGGSRDGTVALAERHGARVVHHAWRGWAAARERGRVEARGKWILAVDADERVSEPLAAEVRARIGAAPADVDAYSIPIKTFYRDRWLRHGGFWPARRVRLYRRARARYPEDREVHERVAVEGRVEALAEPLEHRSFASFGEALRRVERYSTVAAAGLAARGERAGVLRIAGHATARFLRGYVLRGGFLDGVPGLWFAALGGYEALAKYAKLWEAGSEREGNAP